MCDGDVSAVKKVLTAPMFLNLRNFWTERDTSEKLEMKSLDLKETYQLDLSFFVVYIVSFQSYRGLKKNGYVNTFLTASTRHLHATYLN